MNDSNQDELLESWPCRGVADDRLCEAEKAVRRDTLLEHWPKRKSYMDSFDSDEDTVASASTSTSNKRHHHVRSVHFSESSKLWVYTRESMYLLRSLAYTKEDRNEFGINAMIEGFRIKNLIASAPYDSEAESIKYLLRQDIINKEELIGIEHFVLGNPKNVTKRRERHSAAVLWKQYEQQEQQLEDPALNLGEFAESSSLRSSKRARIRAASTFPTLMCACFSTWLFH